MITFFFKTNTKKQAKFFLNFRFGDEVFSLDSLNQFLLNEDVSINDHCDFSCVQSI